MAQTPNIKQFIREVEDFPRQGVRFYDIAPLLGNGALFARVVKGMAEPLPGTVTKIAGFEARGFLFASAMAAQLEIGSVMLRKPGKLPGELVTASYDLEYGMDSLQMQADACGPHDRVLLVDDVIATGGTAMAGIELVEKCGATAAAFVCLIDLPDLGGSKLINERGVPVHSQVSYGDRA